MIMDVKTKHYQRADILQFITKTYGVKIDQANKDYAKAKELIKDIVPDDDRDLLKAKSLARLEDLYTIARAEKNLKECRQLIETINKMFGLNQPDRVDMTSAGEPIKTSIVFYDPKPDQDA